MLLTILNWAVYGIIQLSPQPTWHHLGLATWHGHIACCSMGFRDNTILTMQHRFGPATWHSRAIYSGIMIDNRPHGIYIVCSHGPVASTWLSARRWLSKVECWAMDFKFSTPEHKVGTQYPIPWPPRHDTPTNNAVSYPADVHLFSLLKLCSSLLSQELTGCQQRVRHLCGSLFLEKLGERARASLNQIPFERRLNPGEPRLNINPHICFQDFTQMY